MELLPEYIAKRLTERAKNSLHTASKKSGSPPLALLYSLACERGALSYNILAGYGITSSKIYNRLKLRRINTASTQKIQLASAFKTILERAAQKASEQRQPLIGTEHLLYAVLRMDLSQALSAQKIKQIKKHLEMIFSQNVQFPNLESFSLKSHSHKHAGTLAKHLTPSALDAFCENLTERAQNNMLDPVIGREKEIGRILQILSRRTKNNPLLIGEPGVGKTAIVNGLAQRINVGEVPPYLSNKKVFVLDLNSLVADTIFRGDFEARMRDIIKEASRRDIILFIDEIHAVIGAGSAIGTLDAANIMKPALANGALRCIGATTLDEYKRYIEKDRALERRFQPVLIEEETEEDTLKTLSNLKKLYEKHHDINIMDEAVEASVRLAARYIPDRFLPDKAIDLLDEAASKLKTTRATTENAKKLKELERQRELLDLRKEMAITQENYQDAMILKHKGNALGEEIKNFKRKFILSAPKPTLTRYHVEQTIEEISGVPIARSAEDFKSFKTIECALQQEIIGQEEAIVSLMEALRRRKSGLADETRPVSSFLFLGASGVGKTALAKALAEKTSQKLITLNMAEYAEPHTISRILGSPPGYVGYDEGGELTEKVRRNPYSVVLFDEIEKAHPQVQNILLSILEDGALYDAAGKKISFRNSTVILTSNACSDSEFSRNGLGFFPLHEISRSEGMKEALRPEIISRIDKIIIFNNLGEKDIVQITTLFLEKLKQRLPRLTLNIKQEVIDYIAKRAYKPGEGARLVRSTVEEALEAPLAEYLIRNQEAKNIKIELREGKVVVL